MKSLLIYFLNVDTIAAYICGSLGSTFNGIYEEQKASSPYWLMISLNDLSSYRRSFMIWNLKRKSIPRLKQWKFHPMKLMRKSTQKCCVESFMLFVARCSPYFPFLLLLDNTGHPAPDQQMQVTKLFNHRS